MSRKQRRAAAKLGWPAGTAGVTTAIGSPVAEMLAAGIRHHQAGRLEEAESCYRRVLTAEPDHADALHLRGVIAHQAGRHDQAVELIARAIQRNQRNPVYLYNLGNTLRDQGKLDQAIAAYRQSIRIKPDSPEPHYNLGNALKDQGKLSEAIAAYRTVIRLKPSADAHAKLGIALKEQGKLDEAVAACRAAIRLKPDHAGAYSNLGLVLLEQCRLDEAVSAFREAIRVRPDYAEAHSNLLFSLIYDHSLTPDRLFAEHRQWDEAHGQQASTPPVFTNGREVGRRLKIGYVSPDLRQHSAAYFVEPLLAGHDRQAVEVFCYADVNRPDAVTARLQGLADQWRTTAGLSDDDLAKRIRADGIDILVDLAGHTANNRLRVFARKAAPVQVTWLGYLNTTGLKAIDYRLVDAVTDPAGEGDAFASETLVRLDGGFLCYSPATDAPEPTEPPCIRSGTITFGSFNNPSKLSTATLDAWAALLSRLAGARLLLKGSSFADAATWTTIRARLGERGVAGERIETMPRLPSTAAHLALYSRVDIVLDPFPYNGVTTTCEALWMGVPVIALRGNRHAGRIGASLLTRVGLADLIAESVDDYVEIGVALAGDPTRLGDLRRALRPRMAASPLCDGQAFASKVEAAYRTMWQRWCDQPDNRG